MINLIPREMSTRKLLNSANQLSNRICISDNTIEYLVSIILFLFITFIVIKVFENSFWISHRELSLHNNERSFKNLCNCILIYIIITFLLYSILLMDLIYYYHFNNNFINIILIYSHIFIVNWAFVSYLADNISELAIWIDQKLFVKFTYIFLSLLEIILLIISLTLFFICKEYYTLMKILCMELIIKILYTSLICNIVLYVNKILFKDNSI